MRFHENQQRSIAKTVGYRILIVISNAIIVFFLTHNFELTLGATVAMTIVNTLIYYFYERAWNKVHWGKKIKK
jgi:uncharacterized membrane protein